MLVESRMPGRRRLPDLLGALVLAIGVGALTLGIVKGPDWSWTDVRVLSAFAVAAGLLLLFVVRCGNHRTPVIDLELMRMRNFAVANSLTVIGAAGFFAYTLCNVLFLTSVWRYSVLHAGLAITPGPFIAAAVARPASELADRFGHRWLVFGGALLWASGLAWFVARVGARPRYAGRWLPGMVLLGLGAGVAFPNVSSTAVASAPGDRFATATAINSVARQLGAVVGVALVVAIIGTPRPSAPVDAFRSGWTFAAGCFVAVALGALALGRIISPAATAVAAPQPPARLGRSALQRTGRSLARPHPCRVRSSASPAEFLRGAPLFSELPDAMRTSIVACAERVRVRAGQWLFHQGDLGDCLYLVRSGRLEAIKEERGGETVATVERGAVVGELAVLARSTRSASIRALLDCDLLRIASDDFTALMAGSPALAAALAHTLSVQLQAGVGAPRAPRPLPSTIALVPLQDGLPVHDIGYALGNALAASSRVAGLDATQDTGADADPLAAFAPVVEQCEEDNDHVLLFTGQPGRGNAWTEFCLAHADRTLALTRGGIAPDWLAEQPSLRGCELVGYDIAPGSGAMRGWVAALQPAAVHRLDPGDGLACGAALAARRLSGRAVGVVLSGGGARAFAHLGVLEELTRAGVQIDRVGGVSMGAFIGAQLAAGREIEEIDACCYEEWVGRNPINDYTIPRAALIRGHKGRAMVERVFGELAIEELPRPFYCASADLRTSELVIHRFGSLADGIAATICLPILAPPRVHDDRLLIDGSLLDNLPVAPMAESGEGPVIAIDVKPWSGNGHRRRRSNAAPPIGETIARVIQLASTDTGDAAERHADFVIRTGVDGVGLLEFHQIDAAREAGRRAAREALTAALPGLE